MQGRHALGDDGPEGHGGGELQGQGCGYGGWQGMADGTPEPGSGGDGSSDASSNNAGSRANGPQGGGWRASLTAAGTAVALAFVTVFFGWLPNPFAEEPEATGTPPSSEASSPFAPPPHATSQVPSAGRQPVVEILSRQFPEPVRIPAEFREGASLRSDTALATRLAFTLRNRGDLKAAITEFRFTVRKQKVLYSDTGPRDCLPSTGGDTRITANYDVDLSELGERDPPVTVVVSGTYDLAAGEVERVLFTIGGIDSYDPSLYLVDVQFREGAQKALIAAGTVAFMGPADEAADYLTSVHALARSDARPCDSSLVQDVTEILALADDASPQVARLEKELDVLERRLGQGGE